jgi:hypothetical protein
MAAHTMHQFALRLVVVLYIFTIHNAFAEDDVVQIQGGAIIGVRDSASNLRFWKAIPYAESTGTGYWRRTIILTCQPAIAVVVDSDTKLQFLVSLYLHIFFFANNVFAGGENRFQKPIIRRSWSPSVLNATEYGAGCFSDHHNTVFSPLLHIIQALKRVFFHINSNSYIMFTTVYLSRLVLIRILVAPKVAFLVAKTV